MITNETLRIIKQRRSNRAFRAEPSAPRHPDRAIQTFPRRLPFPILALRFPALPARAEAASRA